MPAKRFKIYGVAVLFMPVGVYCAKTPEEAAEILLAAAETTPLHAPMYRRIAARIHEYFV